MVRRSEDYSGLTKGTCGHVCDAWPLVTRNGRNLIICDTCDDWVEKAPKGHIPGQLKLVDDDIPGF
jgi:hypothetical protein